MIIAARKMAHVITVILSIKALVGYSAETVSYNIYLETGYSGSSMRRAIIHASSPSM
jgi:hypothetical protein